MDEDESKSDFPKLRHHTQIYLNGTKCDLTGNLRKTEVRFVCDPTSVVDIISQVDEPQVRKSIFFTENLANSKLTYKLQSCEYIITVTTAKVCAIPELRPPPAKKPLKIECQPVLTPKEFEKYQRHLKAKEKAALKKAEEMKVKRKENLLKVLEGESIDNIDIETEEGMTKIEGMVGEKLAERLVGELGVILGGKDGAGSKTKWITPEKKTLPIEVEEVKLDNGEKQTRLVQDQFQSMIKHMKKPMARKPLGNKKVNLDPRSDMSEEDEMIEELVKTAKEVIKTEKETLPRKSSDNKENDLSKNFKMVKDILKDKTKTDIKDLKTWQELQKTLQKDLEESVDEIVKETEGEMNMKLDGLDRSKAIQELHNTLQDLMSKLDKAEAEIDKANKEIEQLHDEIDGKEELIDTLKKDTDEEAVEANPFADAIEDDEDSSKKIEEKETASSDSKVNIKVTNFSPTSATEDSASEKRVVKHLERAIKDKLTKAGLDTGKDTNKIIEFRNYFISTFIPRWTTN